MPTSMAHRPELIGPAIMGPAIIGPAIIGPAIIGPAIIGMHGRAVVGENRGMRQHLLQTGRHRTAYLETGPADGPLMIFMHGWPELGLVWRAQLEHFGAAGWRCVAP